MDLRPAGERVTPAAVVLVAARALRERVAAVCAGLGDDEPMRIRLDMHAGGGRSAAELVLDWQTQTQAQAATSSFPEPAVWESTLLPALDTVRTTLRAHAPRRRLVLSGTPSLPAAFALGHALPDLLPTEIEWRQWTRGVGDRPWSLADAADSDIATGHGWRARTFGHEVDGRHLAVLVNVTHDTECRFAATRSELPSMRARIVVDHEKALAVPSEDRPDSIQIHDGAEAASLARLVRRSVRNALDTYGPIEAVHIFLAGPAGLAVLIGQLTNTFPAVVTYDALDGSRRYASAARLLPTVDC